MMQGIKAEDYNKIVKANKESQMIITFVTLPFSSDELSKISFFNDTALKEKSNIIFGVYNGYVGNLSKYIKTGAVDAMTLWKPNPMIDEKPVPKDTMEAFNKRYMILTPDNIEEMKNTYKNIFPKIR